MIIDEVSGGALPARASEKRMGDLEPLAEVSFTVIELQKSAPIHTDSYHSIATTRPRTILWVHVPATLLILPRLCLIVIVVSACLDTYTPFSTVSTPRRTTASRRRQFTTVDKLVEYVSDLAWISNRSPASVARFLKEFRGSPRRSKQARSFVDGLCTRIFRWFAAASVEDLGMNGNSGEVAIHGGHGFIEAASFVGHLVGYGLLDHELVRQYLIKPLMTHHYLQHGRPEETVRVDAICRLFDAAGSTLVQGLLEPEDVRLCLRILETAQSSRPGGLGWLSATKLEVQCSTYPDAPHRNLLTREPGTLRAPC